MSERPPLDLRSLAEIDSPEVVREALRIFRRRALTRYVWVGLAAVVLVVAVLWGRAPTTLAERVDGANSVVFTQFVHHVEGGTVALERATDLGDTVGLHFVVLPDDSSQPRPHINVSGQVLVENVGPWDVYIEVERPTSGVPSLLIRIGKRTEEVPLGENAGVSVEFWRQR